MKPIERPKSLTQLVTDAVRQQIITGEIALGSMISEVRIAQKLDVSRTPVREAFTRLEHEGLMRNVPQKGAFVFQLNYEELKQICDVRVALETLALEQAVSDHFEETCQKLAEIMSEMIKAHEAADTDKMLTLDTEYHQQIIDCAGNPFLKDAYQTIAAKMAALRTRLGNHPEHVEKSYQEHVVILHKIMQRQTKDAIKVLVSHIGRKDGSYWQLASKDAETSK